VDAEEQRKIESELRRKLAQPRYPPIFNLPQAHLVKGKERVVPAPAGVDRCPSQGRSEEIIGGSWGGNGIVNRQTVLCVLGRGHDGPHMTETLATPLSKMLEHWQWD